MEGVGGWGLGGGAPEEMDRARERDREKERETGREREMIMTTMKMMMIIMMMRHNHDGMFYQGCLMRIPVQLPEYLAMLHCCYVDSGYMYLTCKITRFLSFVQLCHFII